MRIRKIEKIATLISVDVAAMVIAFILAMYLGYLGPIYLFVLCRYEWSFVTMAASAFLVFTILEVYVLHKMQTGPMGSLLLIGGGLMISAVVTTAAFFFFREPVPRLVFLLFYPCAWGLIGLFRYAYERFARGQVTWKVLLVGDAGQCAYITKLIRDRSYLHAQVEGYLATEAAPEPTVSLPHLGTSKELLPVALDRHVDQIIVAAKAIEPWLMNGLLSAMKEKIDVTDHLRVVEAVTGRVPIEQLSDRWFIDEIAHVNRRYYWYLKRSFDVVFSITGLCLSVPVVALSALLVKLESRGPAFYSQVRIGRRGAPFRVWKLRTMVFDADKGGVHWTLDNDERITRAGRVLRKLHIDEFPQFWNILKGEMSMIGPRPEAETLVTLYTKEIPYYQERHMVTPGVTGWAQINFPYGNSIEDTREKLKYDFYYVKNRTFLLDLLILLRTIRTVVTGRGAI